MARKGGHSRAAPEGDTVARDIARDIARNCLAVSTRRLSRMVTGVFDEALRPHGITTPQLNILVAVRSMGSARPLDLIEALAMEKSTVSRNVSRMVEAGWLRRTVERDLRAHTLALTKAGERMLRDIQPAWHAAQKRAKSMVGKDATRILKTFRPTRT